LNRGSKERELKNPALSSSFFSLVVIIARRPLLIFFKYWFEDWLESEVVSDWIENLILVQFSLNSL
jgi:hypothetical protein